MILMINGSMRGNGGNTGCILRKLGSRLTNEYEIVEERSYLKDFESLAEKLKKADALVMGQPLYVDGIPSNVIRFMEYMLENHAGEYPKLPVYAVTNLGFWEGNQAYIQHEQIGHWCRRMGMVFSGAIGIGSGPMMKIMDRSPMTWGPNKEYGKGIIRLAEAVDHGNVIENIYTHPRWLNRPIYIKISNHVMSNLAAENGLKPKDFVRVPVTYWDKEAK